MPHHEPGLIGGHQGPSQNSRDQDAAWADFSLRESSSSHRRPPAVPRPSQAQVRSVVESSNCSPSSSRHQSIYVQCDCPSPK